MEIFVDMSTKIETVLFFMHVTHGFYYYLKKSLSVYYDQALIFCMKIFLILLKKMADDDYSLYLPPHDDVGDSDGSSSSKNTENTLRCLVYKIKFTIL